MSLDSSL